MGEYDGKPKGTSAQGRAEPLPEKQAPTSPSAVLLARLVEAMPDATILSDDRGRMVRVNARVEALFGYHRAELLGQPCDMLTPERLRHPEGGPRPECIAQSNAVGGLALYGQRRDGTEFPAEIALSPLETEEGVVTITTVRDITERRRAEEARADLLRAQEAVRLRDEFISVASHELRTPLTAAMLQADAILRLARSGEQPQITEVLAGRLRTIYRALQRLDVLISQLLDLSRITAGRLALHRQEVDLAAAVRSVLAQFHDELTRADCELVVDADAPVIGRWDALRVEQIVSNLVSNAIKYGRGKPIEVAVSEPAPGVAELAVRDHGIGIAPEHHARIFERFERIVSERSYGGFGLGLWIVRQIVEAHGGQIHMSSQLHSGSTFVVRLPRYDAPTSGLPSPITGLKPNAKCVMIVDDDAMIRSTFAEILADVGYQVVAAENGLVALEMLRAGARPKIIFLDLMMPIMDGWAFCAEQRKDPDLASIPVAVLSAVENVERRASNLGVAACFRKPSDVGSLLRIAERYCS